MGFTQDAADMDDDVDALLGDDIQFRKFGATDYATIQGFVVQDYAALNQAEIDVAPNTKRIKVQKSLVPSPNPRDKWQCALLGAGAWSMTNAEPQTAGRYWIIELQRSSRT